ncbi:hypothetical protein VMCG_06132 [Cytospora schulzeri]|uniref:Uncharacterized protein n=1 Tax=Cytospora schulzeri TaxID=448051 RepID=A0A423WGP4_9PEZI|nr:hypothetical protein VMCG_06132 [Valsa malicola]
MPANRYRYPAGEGLPRQSERTASENKERAYIAASRRSDRSLEARVQSAFAASQIHKERTGKALKVTEEIVLKEEMYEEEDDLPARYHALMNNPIFAVNPRASAYAITQMGMRDAVAASLSNGDPSRLEEVNRQFAQVFPRFGVPLQQAHLSEPTATHSPVLPGSRPHFTPSTPAQVTSPYSPVNQTQQPGVQHSSPPNVVFNSPFGSPASQGGSPVSANPMMQGNTSPPPNAGSNMHARSMSMSQVEPALMNAQRRATSISPAAAAQRSQQAGQRRSYDEAFSNSQSPWAATFSGVYPPAPSLQSPGMLPPNGLPATYKSKPRRATAHHLALSPRGMHPMHATGFSAQVPANVRHFFQPSNEDRSASFSGTPQGFFTPSPATPGANIVSHTTHAQFQLPNNLRQMQREKKERKRRASQETQEASKAKKVIEARTKTKVATKPTPHNNLEGAARRQKARNEATESGSANNPQFETVAPHTGILGTSSLSKEEQVLKPEPAVAQFDTTMGNTTYNFDDISFDVSNFQGFNTDFPLDTFNMNFDENFDMNQFFTFPASQPESDNAQAVS